MGEQSVEDTQVELPSPEQVESSGAELVYELRKKLQQARKDGHRLEELECENEQLRRRNYTVPIVVEVDSEIQTGNKGSKREEVFITLIANDDKSRADFKRLADMGKAKVLRSCGVEYGDYPDSLVIKFKVGLYDLEGEKS